MYHRLFFSLDEETIILTANRRLAHYLSIEYAHYQIKAGKKTWLTPCILPLTTWISKCWQYCPKAKGILLTNFQEQLIWKKIVPFSNSTALLVQEAWYLMKAWRLSIDNLKLEANNEVQYFIDWSFRFQKELERNDRVSAAELPERLQPLLSHLNLPKKIRLIGFDELVPTFQQLFEALEKKTIAISSFDHYPYYPFTYESKKLKSRLNHSYPQIISLEKATDPELGSGLCADSRLSEQRLPRSFQEGFHDVFAHKPLPNSGSDDPLAIKRCNFQNSEKEIQTMARWAYTQSKKNPQQKIGCIIPDLTQKRAQVLRLFTEIFRNSDHFHISAAELLTQISITRIALRALELDPLHIDILQLGVVLRSSYINSNIEDVCLAAQLDIQLRESGQWKASPSLILYQLNQLQSNFPTATLKMRCQKWFNTKIFVNLTLNAWAQQFSTELTAIGWPGQRSLDSKEYQQWKRWEQLLHEFSALDALSQQQTRKGALNLLRQLAHHTIFQPKSRQETSIQILGVLEAGGHYFDKLWISSLNDKKWPPLASPNPFLPLALQRQHQMPHASSNREMDYTLKLQNRLLKSASEVILSVPLQEEDIQLSPSPLIRHFPKINVETLQLPPWQPLRDYTFQLKTLETINDIKAPLVQENELLAGGSMILQSQSTCPFQAFSKIRLQAKPLKKPHTGFNGSERGNFVHLALDLLWKKIKDWHTLMTYSDGELENKINKIVESLLNQEECIPTLFLNVEKKRLKQLIKKWLMFEKKRPAFKVSQRETSRHIKIGPLRLEVRVDRIDAGNFIIDYKTGSQNRIKDWFSNRLKSIQLPLYCAYAIADVNGVAYAEVRSQKMTLKGLINPNEKLNSFSKIKPSPIAWNELIHQWKTLLHQLALDFVSGKAEVNPIDSKTDCEICQLHSLCRIGETE